MIELTSTRIRIRTIVALTGFLFADCATSTSNAQKIGLCQFDTKRLVFDGSPKEQSKCLLRRVEAHGSKSSPQTIPNWLLEHVTKPVRISSKKLSAYLDSKGISATDVGGPIPATPDVQEIKYFVIHDTSYPEIDANVFPAEIDTKSYRANNLSIWRDTKNRVNLITNRLGESKKYKDFAAYRPKPALKIEQTDLYPKARKIFVHIENVQPRLKPEGSKDFWKAPDPGFTPAQLERIALCYTVASMRAGHWLIPALHFNIDSLATKKDPHDDPQNFDLGDWSKKVQSIASTLEAQ
ncbi:hypothetical protein [Methylocystis sp. SB2]|uniref:hypothetical protein n=1 Tax=Methylocystis sp. (strain SB2) TaxID=743836 RepID=UPI0004A3F957|nr:hypothetical protein [Methylocystis sp. SB2]ULO25074.1 hypothetical protein LNB28_06715 [Methylocystis sp. SB2]